MFVNKVWNPVDNVSCCFQHNLFECLRLIFVFGSACLARVSVLFVFFILPFRILLWYFLEVRRTSTWDRRSCTDGMDHSAT